jgi:ribosome biogenesis GTPase A
LHTFDFDKLNLTGWYPGHMLKAGRDMQERLKLVDAVVELLDARIPSTSRNPTLRKIVEHKPRFVVFNKSNLVTPEYCRRWSAWFRQRGENVMFLDALTGFNVEKLLPSLKRFVDHQRRSRGATTGMLRSIRLMIVGIPNVGKSTLVNRLVVSRRAAVGPRPGVTRNQQWIRLKNGMDLLDTPGVLWPKICNKRTELKLALVGGIKDDLVGEQFLAEFLWEQMCLNEGAVDWGLYDLEGPPELPEHLLEAVARRRGILRAGGELDLQKSAVSLLKDYRDGRLGRLELEQVPEPGEDGAAD